jgi:4-alpha-glucanotransferase
VLGPLALIAEDLGVVKPGVKALRDRFGFPGLRVLQMAFGTDSEADSYKTHGHPRHCVAYTGTHDNDTSFGWFNDQSTDTSTRTPEEIENERATVLAYLGTDGREIHWDLIRHALLSAADTAIVPVQDLLGLDSRSRMNRPGTASGNWGWRLAGSLPASARRRWSEMTRIYGRASSRGSKR